MMTFIQSYVRQGRHTLRTLSHDPRVHAFARAAARLGAGFLLGAASLANTPQPFALALVCATAGVNALLVCLGGVAGYLAFWGAAGAQGVAWLLFALPCALLLGKRRIRAETKLLMSAIAALIVAASGVLFQNAFADDTSVPVYLLRVALAAGSTRLFETARESRLSGWLCRGVAVLALAQVAPTAYLNLGFLAAGALGASGAFPPAALAGLALDLAGVTRASMAAVMCLTCFVRLIPRLGRWGGSLSVGAVYLTVSALCGAWDLTPLPMLMLGALLGTLIPARDAAPAARRGEMGVAQVRLELAAGVMAQTQQVLLTLSPPPIDEEALICGAAQAACAGCPCRRNCRDTEAVARLPTRLLHAPLPDEQDAHFCRKSGRVNAELRRARAHYRALRDARERQQECRDALTQQYQFLADYLRALADRLPARFRQAQALYRAEVSVCCAQRGVESGDRCLRFAGTECRYYILLCDGMGTGLGAAAEGESALRLLRQLLCAGFPAEHALRSLNSLYALRGSAGASTVDLAELELDTGRGALYKWGAAPSYLVSASGAQKLGAATPPPGLSLDARETRERLSLRRGETLVLLSDGIGALPADEPFDCGASLDTLAADFLARRSDGSDDATVAAVRLIALEPHAQQANSA